MNYLLTRKVCKERGHYTTSEDIIIYMIHKPVRKKKINKNKTECSRREGNEKEDEKKRRRNCGKI